VVPEFPKEANFIEKAAFAIHLKWTKIAVFGSVRSCRSVVAYFKVDLPRSTRNPVLTKQKKLAAHSGYFCK